MQPSKKVNYSLPNPINGFTAVGHCFTYLLQAFGSSPPSQHAVHPSLVQLYAIKQWGIGLGPLKAQFYLCQNSWAKKHALYPAAYAYVGSGCFGVERGITSHLLHSQSPRTRASSVAGENPRRRKGWKAWKRGDRIQCMPSPMDPPSPATSHSSPPCLIAALPVPSGKVGTSVGT